MATEKIVEDDRGAGQVAGNECGLSGRQAVRQRQADRKRQVGGGTGRSH